MSFGLPNVPLCDRALRGPQQGLVSRQVGFKTLNHASTAPIQSETQQNRGTQ
jgi:hypothetical protein